MKGIKLIECPRDAMQGWPHPISTSDKVAYHKLLLKVGFDTLDIGSFVSPKAIPQMADTRQVLKELAEEGVLDGERPRLLTIVANVRGAIDAATTEVVDDLGFPFSISETFQQRNAGTGIKEARIRLAKINDIVRDNGKNLVTYLSMGFGNPYGDPWSPQLLVDQAGALIEELGLHTLALSDTVGTAEVHVIRSAFEALVPAFPEVEFGAHLHALPWDADEKIRAAFEGGCRRFDGAIRGVGGCPMAGNELVGNMPTERLVSFFESEGLWECRDSRAWSAAQSYAADLFAG